MSDATSQPRQEERKSGGQKEFGQILAETREQLKEDHSMVGKTVGYGRNGQVFIGHAMQRAYNWPKGSLVSDNSLKMRSASVSFGYRGHYEEIYQ